MDSITVIFETAFSTHVAIEHLADELGSYGLWVSLINDCVSQADAPHLIFPFDLYPEFKWIHDGRGFNLYLLAEFINCLDVEEFS